MGSSGPSVGQVRPRACGAPASGGRSQSRNVRCREKPKGCLPTRFWTAKRNERRQVRRPSKDETLGRVLDLGRGFGNRLGFLLRVDLGSELLPHLGATRTMMVREGLLLASGP
jgi:hypothetical protein